MFYYEKKNRNKLYIWIIVRTCQRESKTRTCIEEIWSAKKTFIFHTKEP